MSLRELPARPNLDHLKNQAHTLLRQVQESDAAAAGRFTAFGISATQPKYADALHVIAREYGFDTWPALKQRVEISSEDATEALIAAIRSDNAALVREVLARHASLRERIDEPLPNFAFDAPAILGAVHRKNRAMVDALLDAGANINARSRWWAGSYGVLDEASPELSAYLIERGATVDIHAAARLGMRDRVRQLLAADPTLIHARGGDGQLPLHFAKTVEIAALLLDHGAEIDARDIDHESTAAQYMACTDRREVARYLLSRGAKADILMASALGDRALVEEILNNDPDTVRVTVSERNFPKQDPRSGGIIYIYGFGITKSPHLLAHEFGHKDVFDLLMQRSAPWLRLIVAAEIEEDALFQRLLAQHPNVIAKLNERTVRRLMGVVVRNNTRSVVQLLEAGWPANVSMDNNQTALHFAAWHGNLAVVRALLAHGAAINIYETEHGGNALAWALHGSMHSWQRDRGDYPAVTQALLDAGMRIPAPENMPLVATDDVLEVVHEYARQHPEASVSPGVS